MAILIVIDGPAKDQKFALGQDRLTMIGRGTGCSFQIIDPELSRHHMQIRLAEDQKRHYVIDYQSSNGVRVNDKKIESETLLNDRDVISIGQTVMVYSTNNAMDAKGAAEAWKRPGQGHVPTVVQDGRRPADGDMVR